MANTKNCNRRACGLDFGEVFFVMVTSPAEGLVRGQIVPSIDIYRQCYHNSQLYGRQLYYMASPLCLFLCACIQPRKHGSPQEPCNPTSWTDATPAMQAAAPKVHLLYTRPAQAQTKRLAVHKVCLQNVVC